jgi:hypothetical protein
MGDWFRKSRKSSRRAAAVEVPLLGAGDVPLDGLGRVVLHACPDAEEVGPGPGIPQPVERVGHWRPFHF